MATPISITFHDKTSADKAYLTAIAAAVTSGVTLAAQKHQPANATTGNLTMTLPTGQSQGTEISVEKIDSSTNTVAVTGNIRGAASQTVTLYWQYESIGFKADANGSWWPQYGHKTKTALDAAYATKPTGTAAAGKYVDGGTNAWTALPAAATVSDATTTSKGIVQLAGDLAGTAAAPILANILTAGAIGSATQIPIINYDAKGRITSVSSAAAASTYTPTDATTGAKGIVQLAGDLAGTAAAPILTTSGVSAGTYGGASAVPVLTVDAKGRVTSASTVAVSGSGSSAAAAVLSTQLTSDGTNGNFSLPANAFTTIPNVGTIVDTVSGYSASTYKYTIPTTGTYMVVGKIRVADNPTANANMGVGVGTDSNSDGGTFTWVTMPGSPFRTSLLHARVENYTAGTTIRLYGYSSSAVSIVAAYMSVVRLDGTSALQNPFTTTGDLVYASGTTPVRLAGPTSTTKQILTSIGTGSASQAPVWGTLGVTDIFGAAALASPTFTGTPAAPTATAGANTTQIATTAFATTADALKANIASPTFTGTPAAPTPATADNGTTVATTAFVRTAITTYAPTPSDASTTAKGIVQLAGDLAGTAAAPTVPALANKANLASPTFTGTPAAPTPATADNSTTVATTAFVRTAVTTYAPTASDASTTAKGVVQLAGDLAGTAAAPTVPALANKANLASPTFTGTPAAPTASAGDSTTAIATTAFVTTANNLKANLASPTFTGTPAAPTPALNTNTTQIATAAMVTSAMNAAQAALVGLNALTASYTLQASDGGRLLTYTSSSAGTFTLPTNATVGWGLGTVITFANLSTGALTIAGASGVTVNSPAGLRITTQYAQASAIKIATDGWLVSGATVA